MHIEAIVAPAPTPAPESVPPFPRIIHQTWKRRQVYRPLRKCMDSFHKLNPGWEIRFYTDADCENFIREHHPGFLETYFSYPAGILRADIFRVLVLWTMGGVYADIDVECLRPLDDLLKAVGDGQWEVLLTTDHPIHERVHYGGRSMWMNDFMVARPKARFFGRIIEAFKRGTFGCPAPEDAVQVTGPGLFSTVVEEAGGPEQAGVTPVPCEWIHPLPDLTLEFPERQRFERAVLKRSWRKDDVAFVVHYWYHTWSKGLNTLTKYEATILQTDGEIVERRLQADLPLLNSRAGTAGRALAEFAERGQHLLMELHGSAVAGDGMGWSTDTFHEIAVRALQNLGKRHVRVKPAPFLPCEQVSPATGHHHPPPVPDELYRQASSDFLAAWKEQAGLVYLAGHDCTEKEARAQAEVARLLLDRDLIAPGGCVLIENHVSEEAEVSPASYAKEIFKKAGFSLLEKGEQLLFQRPDFPIPKVIHVISPTGTAPLPSRLQLWLLLQRKAGWKVEIWKESQLLQFIEEQEPDLLDLYTSWNEKRHRFLMAGLLVLKHRGGIYVDGRALPYTSLKDLLWGKRLVTFSSLWPDEAQSNAGPAIGDSLIASVPRHPFWNGLESDLIARRNDSSGRTALDSGYLTDRVWGSVRFFPPADAPYVVNFSTIAGHFRIRVPAKVLAGSSPLVSRLCNERDFQTQWFRDATALLGETLRYHRKLWENCFIFHALNERNCLCRSSRGLAFVAESDTVSTLVSQRVSELLVLDVSALSIGNLTRQERIQRFADRRRKQGSPSDFRSVNYDSPDPSMLELRPLGEFDFVFSGSVLRQCRNVASTIKFLEKAVRTLAPGGVAIFTFDFALSRAEDGENPAFSMLRTADVERIRATLENAGCRVDLDLRIGQGEIESFIDWAPYVHRPHLRLLTGDVVITSAALIVEGHRAQISPSVDAAQEL